MWGDDGVGQIRETSWRLFEKCRFGESRNYGDYLEAVTYPKF